MLDDPYLYDVNGSAVRPVVVDVVVSSLVWGSLFLLIWVLCYSDRLSKNGGSSGRVFRTSGWRLLQVRDKDTVNDLSIFTTNEKYDDIKDGHNVSSGNSNTKLLIDGCNGPIRFSQKMLKHRNTVSEALSLLHTSSLSQQQQQQQQQQQHPKNVSGITGQRTDEVRLAMIPSLHHLIVGRRTSGTTSLPLLHSVSIIFDGVSQSKRRQQSIHSPPQDDKTKEQWYKVTSKISVVITDMYDEADNVIVNMVTTMTSSLPSSSSSSSKGHDSRNTQQKEWDGRTIVDWDMIIESMRGNHPPDGTTSIVYMIHRTHRGPGKSRRMLQSVGLLREDSVACLFGWTPALQKDACRIARNLQKLPTDLFHPIQRRVLCSHCQTSPGPVAVAEPSIPPTPTKTMTMGQPNHLLPVVVTDDVFLRQRVVKDASGCVMSFDQLWILLKEQEDHLDCLTTKSVERKEQRRRFW
jgi:hypothetical protein